MMAPLFIEPCLPTISRSVPTGSQWAYEIKHDGFRFLAVRQDKRVRVYSRGGHDWSKQLPAITKALMALPVRSLMSTVKASSVALMAGPTLTACAAATVRRKPSYTPSTCWGLTVAICAKSHGRDAALC
jgi:hypothetical protein